MSNRELYMDHVRQNFWKEMVGKEAILRRDWHLKYSKNFINTEPYRSNKRDSSDVVPRPNSALPKMRELVKTEAEKAKVRELWSPSRSGASTPDLALSGGSSSGGSIGSISAPKLEQYRPVSEGTRRILYNGLSYHGEGRFLYLEKRKSHNPEDKYGYPVTNQLEHGWRIADSMKSYKPSQYGRGAIVRDSFYRHGGVF